MEKADIVCSGCGLWRRRKRLGHLKYSTVGRHFSWTVETDGWIDGRMMNESQCGARAAASWGRRVEYCGRGRDDFTITIRTRVHLFFASLPASHTQHGLLLPLLGLLLCATVDDESSFPFVSSRVLLRLNSSLLLSLLFDCSSSSGPGHRRRAAISLVEVVSSVPTASE